MPNGENSVQNVREEDTKAWRRGIAADTQSYIPSVLSLLATSAPRNAYLTRWQDLTPLDKLNPYYPNISTKVTVIFKDTLDAAIALEQSKEEMGDLDEGKVCVLNFANAYHAGGGWLNGQSAQEEQLCFRSTLSAALPERFYPIQAGECIYSPSIFVFKDNEEKDFGYMWCGQKNEYMPEVSVISVAATNRPALNADNTAYGTEREANLMKDNVRLVLRLAAYHHHRRLVLGALGCDIFGHPTGVVAQIFHDVLKEAEFGGWFERITFAILDKSRDGKNFQTFKSTLDGLSMVWMES
ncbi:hypothetical protein N7495_003810 [Penicillium taxi]|uniref:uncharacterized protein n=1 Tax=Penicillium taxi TaxID=168475 RepID=UPI002544E0D3|nr:uncharacterized protein N7495_003810 [Penicillium taxi]KAJ5899066.1 hypothetical protein N7495_003810 [Penicillium taxi]